MQFAEAPTNQDSIQVKAASLIESMGKLSICHPSNRIKRITPFKKTAKQLRANLGGKNI